MRYLALKYWILTVLVIFGFNQVHAFPDSVNQSKTSIKKNAESKKCEGGLEFDQNHVLIFDSGVDELIVSYWLRLTNPNNCVLSVEVPFIFPDNVKDWRSDGQLDPKSFVLAEDGNVVLKTELKPDNQQIISLFLKVSAWRGKAQLNYKVPENIVGNLSWLVPKEQLVLTTTNAVPTESVEIGNKTFVQYIPSETGSDVATTFAVSGVLQGRSQVYTSLLVGVALLSVLGVVAIKL